MPWQYGPTPATIQLPACANRGRVSMVLRCVFVCGDCGHPFTAVWVAESVADWED